MKVEYFDKLLHGNNGIKISDEWNIFNDYELYNFKTNESKQYKNLDELLRIIRALQRSLKNQTHSILIGAVDVVPVAVEKLKWAAVSVVQKNKAAEK